MLQAATQEDFIRLLLDNERPLLRCVMSVIPNIDDARDVLQETAIALWESIDEYDSSRPFLPWASQYAILRAREFLRKERRRKRLVSEEIAELLQARRAEIGARLDQRRELLNDCLKRLPEYEKELLRAFYFEEQSVKELVNRFHRSSEAVYKSLQRIRHILHNCISLRLKEGCQS